MPRRTLVVLTTAMLTFGFISNAAAYPSFTGGYCGNVFDSRYVYFVPYGNQSLSNHGTVLRYDTTKPFFGNSGSWTEYDPGANGVGNDPDGYHGAAFDGRYIYFAPYHNGSSRHGEVLRYDTTKSFTDAGSWATYTPGFNAGYVGAIYVTPYVYFVPYGNNSGNHGDVLRYDTRSAFNNLASWASYDAGHNDGYRGAVSDGRYIYFVPNWNGSAYHGDVLRYDTTQTFNDAGSWTSYDPGAHGLGTNPTGYAFAAFDNRYIYFAPHKNSSGYHGEVLRYDTTQSFTSLGSWAAYDPGANGVGTDPDGYFGAVFDGRYVYFSPRYNGSSAHSEVLRYDTALSFTTPASWSTFSAIGHKVGKNPVCYMGVVYDNTRYVYFSPGYVNSTSYDEVLRYDSKASGSQSAGNGVETVSDEALSYAMGDPFFSPWSWATQYKGPPAPVLSGWGLILLTALLSTMTVLVMVRRRRACRGSLC